MPYIVTLKRSAEKELEHLPNKIHDRIVNHLISLKENPRPNKAKKLHGREGYRRIQKRTGVRSTGAVARTHF